MSDHEDPSDKEPKHVRLDSYHEGSNGEIINHDSGVLRRKPHRRFVFSWREHDAKWSLVAEEAGGAYSGFLERNKHNVGPVDVCVDKGPDGEWALDIKWTDHGLTHEWTIKAVEEPVET